MNAVELEQVSFGYGGSPLFEEFSVTVGAGEFLAVLGPNGAGKTTLLRLMAGLLVPTSGRVRLRGRPLSRLGARERARLVSFVPQESTFAFDYTVHDVVMWGRNPYLGAYATPGPEDERLVEQALHYTDVDHLAFRSVNAISSGERQRVVLARALAQQAPILLLDEATAHLDLAHQARIMQILAHLQSEGRTLVFLSHDFNWPALYCDRLLLLAAGRALAEGPPSAVVTDENIRRAYGVRPLVLAHPVAGKPQVLPRPE